MHRLELAVDCLMSGFNIIAAASIAKQSNGASTMDDEQKPPILGNERSVRDLFPQRRIFFSAAGNLL
jgi:hypothetical protein